MNALTLVIISLCVFAIAYRFYGLFIANKVLGLKSERLTPAVTMADGHDYVKTNKFVLFGHHFAVSKDHVHILASVPPHVSVSNLLKRLKGRSSRKMLSEYRTLARQFWGRHLWARGYFAASGGNVTADVIAQYIDMQDKMERARDDDFQIGDEG
jgi:hypothetical protein